MTYTYPMPNPAETAKKIEAAGGPHIDASQVLGMATTHGVTLSWLIKDGFITIDPTKIPWYVTEGAIKEALDKFFGGQA